MFKHTISELKEALVCLQAGKVTLGYPFQPHAPEAGFRGKPEVNGDLCIGCGACANACPPRLISLTDEDGYRRVSFELGRCTYCGSCRDVCPEKAIRMSEQFETATPATSDLRIDIKLKLVSCRLCGAVIGTRRAANRVEAKLTEAQLTESMRLDLCISCKRKEALNHRSLMLDIESLGKGRGASGRSHQEVR